MELACNYSSDSHHSEGSDELSPNKTDDLSDEYEEIIDDGPAVVSETPKSFLPELKLQAYFSSSAKHLSIEEKVNHAIKSNLSKIMPPKGHMSVWTDSNDGKENHAGRNHINPRNSHDASRLISSPTKATKCEPLSMLDM